MGIVEPETAYQPRQARERLKAIGTPDVRRGGKTMDNLNESQSCNTAESSESPRHGGRRFFSPRHIKLLVAGLMTICLLGTVYYLNAPVTYEANASLLLTSSVARPCTQDDGTDLRLMTTHCDVIKATAVLEKAVALLGPEHRTDLEDAPSEQQVGVLRKNLRVTPARNANILEPAL